MHPFGQGNGMKTWALKIAATALMLAAMKERSFVVTTALIKSS